MVDSKQAHTEPQEKNTEGENEANEFDEAIKNSLTELEVSVTKRNKENSLENQDRAKSKVEEFQELKTDIDSDMAHIHEKLDAVRKKIAANTKSQDNPLGLLI